LRGKVALVAGATRGEGRAIAVALALAGALVYATGRSTRGHPATAGRPETIEETAEIIRNMGGTAIPVRVDHTDVRQVRRLAQRIRRDQRGRLDILVNDIWGCEGQTEWGVPPWKLSWSNGRTHLERGLFTHLITTRYALPLMVARRKGIVLEVTDGDDLQYRGSLFYDLVKVSIIRQALALHSEFEEAGLNRMEAVAVTPGWLRSEQMLDRFKVRESNWWEAVPRAGKHFLESETPYFLARGIVALCADPQRHRFSGTVVASWTLARRYGVWDLNGTRPQWDRALRAIRKEAS
jgi:NAD(P)-dependent dehydrogenase (short-subunit alcohol dehydrogenase family)